MGRCVGHAGRHRTGRRRTWNNSPSLGRWKREIRGRTVASLGTIRSQIYRCGQCRPPFHIGRGGGGCAGDSTAVHRPGKQLYCTREPTTDMGICCCVVSLACTGWGRGGEGGGRENGWADERRGRANGDEDDRDWAGRGKRRKRREKGPERCDLQFRIGAVTCPSVCCVTER